MAGEQFASAAPTYNGASQRFAIMLAFFEGRALPERLRRGLIDFAHPPVAISANQKPEAARNERHGLSAPRGFVAAYETGTVHFIWDSGRRARSHYRIHCGIAPGRYQAVYPAVGNSLQVQRYAGRHAFEPGRRYYAAIETVSANGVVSRRSPEIHFDIRTPAPKRPSIPLKLELKVLWANLHALVGNWRM
jgi:hypothetical protein